MRSTSTSRLGLTAVLLFSASCGDKLVLGDDSWPTPVVPTIGAAGMFIVTNSGDDSVSWIDPTSLEQVYKMPVGLLPPEREGPHHGAAAADGKTFFVGLSNYVPGSGSGPHGSHGTGTVPGSLLKYDALTGELIGEARVDRSPGDVRLTPDGAHVVQTHFDLVKIMDVDAAGGPIEDMYAPLAIVDAATMDVKLVPVCPAPHGVAVSADSKTAYVACYASDEIGIVDLVSHDVTRFHLGDAPITPTTPTYQPYAVSISPSDGTVWASDLKSGDLRIFDPATGVADPRSPIVVNGSPFFGQFSRDGKYFYVAVQTSNTFVVVDTATGTVAATLPLALAEVCRSPHAVLLTPDEKNALVVCEGDHITNGTVAVISIVNPTTPAVAKRIEVGVFPDDAFWLEGQP